MAKKKPTSDLDVLVDTLSRNGWSAVRANLERSEVLIAGSFARSVNASSKRDYLREQLSVVRTTHPIALPSVLEALRRTESKLSEGRVVIGNYRAVRNKQIKPSIFNVLASELAVPFAEVLRCFRVKVAGLDSADLDLLTKRSIVDHLQDVETCKSFCKDIQLCINKLEDKFESVTSSSDDVWRACLEALDAIRESLQHTVGCWPKTIPRWCKCCFRRVAPGFWYCREHYPSSDDPAKSKTYRRGEQVRLGLGIRILNVFRHRSLRRAVPEPVELLCSGDVQPLGMPKHGVLVPSTVKEFLKSTVCPAAWGRAAPIWDEFLKQSCSILLKQTNCRLASDYTTWPDFVCGLQAALQNRDEKTSEPIWILLMVMDAEDWFRAEAACIDLRCTGIAKEILAMHQVGQLKQSEIAAQLSVSRQFVSRVLGDAKEKEGRRTLGS